MKMRLIRKLGGFKIALSVGVMVVAFAASTSSASAFVTYNNFPVPMPGNVPSLGLEAYNAAEFGGAVDLGGFFRRGSVVTVGMSSWGCESGRWYTPADPCVTSRGAHEHVPITLNVYKLNPDDSLGDLVVSETHTFRIPYRPSADPSCTGGKWKDRFGKCNNGLLFPITFPLIWQKLPDKAVFTLTYNTSHYGPSPIGTSAPCYSSGPGCIYDSLNIALTDPSAPTNHWTVGSNPLPDDLFQNAQYGFNYCDNGTGGVGVLRRDAGCWTGYQPLFNVVSFLP